MREERSPVTLTVTGNIPLYAAGTLYRNGPGARKLLDYDGNVMFSCSHWFDGFDGFAQLHKFELIPSQDCIKDVRFSSRFNVDSLMEELRRTGRFDGYSFAQKRDPCMGLFRKVICFLTPVPKATIDGLNIPVTISTNSPGFPAKFLSE